MLSFSLGCLYDIYRMVDYLPEGLDAQSDCLIAQVIRLASRPVRLSDGLKGPSTQTYRTQQTFGGMCTVPRCGEGC
jgi:hypothetical protein